MTSVSSSAIKGVDYDHANRTLTIHWHSGHTSTHEGVPQEKFAAFVTCDSKGKYFHAHIKNAHPAR